jgi:hypothetical protein
MITLLHVRTTDLAWTGSPRGPHVLLIGAEQFVDQVELDPGSQVQVVEQRSLRIHTLELGQQLHVRGLGQEPG